MKNIFYFILLSVFLFSCENKTYTDQLPKSKVTIKLYSNQGNERIKTFILENENIYTLECRPDGNLFDKGYYNLYCFKTYNSWSGSTKCLELNVSSFKIIKIINYEK